MLRPKKTQKHLTNKALENPVLCQGIIESVPDALIGVNDKGIIQFANKQAEVIFDYQRDELIGAHIEMLMTEKPVTGDDVLGRYYYKKPITRIMGQSTRKLSARTKQGKVFPVEIGLSSMQTKDGLLVISSIRDVTTKRKLEEALRSSEERLSITLASIGDGVISTDANGKIVFMNSMAEQLTGWTLNEANSKGLSDVYAIIDEDTGTPLVSPLKRIIEDGLVMALENHTILVTRDGRKLVISNNGAPIRDSEGKIQGAVIVFHDSTEKTNARKKLAQSNARFNSAFFNNPAAMAIFRQGDNRFIEVNQSFELLTAYSRDELLGKTFEEIAIVDMNDRITILSNLKLFGRVKDEEFNLRSKSGSLKPVLLSMEPIDRKDDSDVLITFIDMSAWKEAEQRYQSIFEKTHEGIYQSSPEGRFITANPSMAKIFGYTSPKELISSIDNIGRQIYVDPEERLQLKALLEKDGKANDLEFRAFKKNKEIIWVRVNIRIERDTYGIIKYYEGTLLDITDEKLAKEKLNIQFAELQKTNHELDRFVYSASHDLRSPLSSILGIINLAKLEKLSPRSLNYLSLIRTSIERLDGFIKDILNYSRNSRTKVLNEEINFEELLATAQANLRFMNGSDRLQVKVEIDKQAPFFADKTRCSIVIENILSNAIKYQDFDKATNTLHISIVQSEKSASMCFHDNGIGIDQRHMNKMFNMFYRATDEGTGSGLGLYIMKECILKMRGTVTVKSERSVFTKLEIEIPNNLK